VSLYHTALRAPESPAEATLEFLATPGLGLVKAGFLSQMVGAESGCIDGHNLKLFHLTSRQVKCDSKVPPEKRAKRVEEYLQLCHNLGGSEFLWNNWCEHVAKAKKLNNFKSAEEVSRYHVEALR
jgi:hypothetical protein